MAYLMTFAGRFEFAGPGPLRAALDAFDAHGADSTLRRHDLQVDGVSVSVDWKAQAPASMWLGTQVALGQLAERASAGSVACQFFADSVETETIPARALAARPAAVPPPPAPAPPPRPLPPLALDRIEPWLRFSVPPHHARTGTVVDMPKPKMYKCGKCGHGTRVDPRAMLPPWPMQHSVASVFDAVLQAQFDAAYPEGLYRYDFFCRHCRTPVRLLFAIVEMRDSSFRAHVHAIVETQAPTENA
jgi:hypothetical protein